MPPRTASAAPPPFVYLDFQYEEGLLYICIANAGPGAAHRIPSELSRVIKGPGGKELNGLKVFKEIGFLPPGKNIRVFVDTFESYSRRGQPKVMDAKVVFRDASGRRHVGMMHHDLTIYDDMVSLERRQ